MGLLIVLAVGCTFAAGFITCLLWSQWRDYRLDEMVRRVADDSPTTGLGL